MLDLNKKILFLLSFLFIFSLILGSVKAISLGAAPGVMDIGELERGKEYSIDFYLLTNSDRDLLTTLSFLEGKRSMFEKNVTGRYTLIPAEISEESMSDWIRFMRSKMVVSNKRSFPVRFPDGTVVNANERATFILNVPQDAEPGYHTFEVVLSPSLPKTGTGMGISMIGVTRPVFIFKIPGIAERKGTIEGIAGSRLGSKAVIDVLFRNSGTVTISAKVSSLKIYNETGYYVDTLKGGYVIIPPKSTGILKVYWNDKDEDKQKTIKVEATVGYLTGSVTKESMVIIPRSGITTRAEGKAEEFPWWIIILIIGIILLYIYWRRR